MDHEATKISEDTKHEGHERARLRVFALRDSGNLRGFVVPAILLAYLVLGLLFAVNTPAWQAPDEPAHYNYVRYIAENASLPVLHFGDYPHGYLEQIKTAQFPPGMSIEPVRYESHQPPLYYALLGPVFSITGGSLIALRLVSVLLGAGIVLLAYAIARRVVPDRPAIALGAAAFVAFLPQHLATVSQVGNDVLAELLLAGVLYVLVGMVREGEDRHPRMNELANSFIRDGRVPHRSLRPLLILSVLLGLIAITKTTAYIAAPLVGGVVVWRWVRERAPAGRIARDAALLILPAALIALPWFARNAAVYGWPDIFGLVRHDEIVQGQTRTAGFIAENGAGVYAQRAVEFTFKSFWGVFGWLSTFMDTRVYLALALFNGAALAGFARREGRGRSRPGILLALSALLTLLTYIYYNVSFVQHQGRYLFTALIPIALGVALGWESAIRPRNSRLIATALAVLAVGLAVGGMNAGTGLPKWPLALTLGFAAALVLAGLLPPRWRTLAYAAPFVLLPIVSVYALFGVIGPLL